MKIPLQADLKGILLRRYKRFLADIVTDEGEHLCIHCPNTGSMLNCMGEGARVWFQRNSDPKRKLPGTWELVETAPGVLACVNTARPNAQARAAIEAGVAAQTIDVVRFKKPTDGLGETEVLIIEFGRQLFRERRVDADRFAAARATSASCAGVL